MSVVEHLVKLRRPDTDVHDAMDVFGLDDDYKFKCNHERPSGIQRLFVQRRCRYARNPSISKKGGVSCYRTKRTIKAITSIN